MSKVFPSSSAHIVAAKMHSLAAPDRVSNGKGHDSDGDIIMSDCGSTNAEVTLKCFPGPVLGRIWPASRTLLGLRTCQWLREELLAHAEAISLQRKSTAIVSSAQISSDLSRFPHTSVLLQQARCSPFAPQSLAEALLLGLTAAIPHGLYKTLSHLDLARTRLGDDGANLLSSALEACHGLGYVDLEANGIADAGATALARGLSSSRALEHLSLRDNKVGDSGAHSLSKTLRGCEVLRLLDLGQNEIGDDGTASVAMALGGLAALQTLNLSWNGIGQEGARHLACALEQAPSLRQVYLGRNKIGDAGVGFLADALPGCPTLEHLDLGRNEVGDFGARKLAGVLVACVRLAFLDLGRNRIGDDGEEELSKMRRQREQALQINFGGQRSLTNYT